MKYLISTIAIVLSLSVVKTTFGQESFTEKIAYSTFKTWVQSQNIDGYKYVGGAQDGEAEYGEKVQYTADFRSMDGGLSIKISDLSEFSSYKLMNTPGTEIFKIGEYDAVYIPLKGKYTSSMYVIKRPDLNVTITISAMPMKSKDEMGVIYNGLEFSELQ
jgi:hypothetical protein